MATQTSPRQPSTARIERTSVILPVAAGQTTPKGGGVGGWEEPIPNLLIEEMSRFVSNEQIR